jgi:hypothetical protein
VVKGETASNAVTVLSREKSAVITPGALYAGENLNYPYPEGLAETQASDVYAANAVYTSRLTVGARQLGLAEAERLYIADAAGKSLFLKADGARFQLSFNRLDYISAENRLQLPDIRVIAADVPSASISDIYYHVRHWLDGGGEIMLIFVSGFDSAACREALANKSWSFINSYFTVTEAAGVYPFTAEAWRRAALEGLEEEAAALDARQIRELKFNPASFDKDISALCADFSGAALIAPLPPENAALNFETFNSFYFERSPQF